MTEFKVSARVGAPTPPIKVCGKFLQADGRRFWIKGVTYGTFAPSASGRMFPDDERIGRDLDTMASVGINVIRTYTVPDRSFLDAAAAHGLRVMAGLPWAQHIAFLDDARICSAIRRELVAHVRALKSHSNVALIAIGNEIPAPVVRWHGKARIERFLSEIYQELKSTAPECLFTYVNYPPTEYLELPFLDLVAFNVYLHREPDLRAYLARLQLLAAEKPLLLAEAGADSMREGRDGQAALTAMQLRSAFAEGACGAVAFAWTDEWWRGGQAVTDWAFGLVEADRHPKPALRAVTDVYAQVPWSEAERKLWPDVSVVVCAYNAAETIGECLRSLEALQYPKVEIIVVNDGSTDETGRIAHGFRRVRVIDTPNGGLATARNIGLEAGTGAIVAYTDADVRVEPDWLDNLIQPLLRSDVVGVGGPNIVPREDSWVAQCVGRAPGGPTHVLFDDRIAEHVPGCNMAFWRQSLRAIRGFNPIFLRAGDDVDVCWRLQARGWRIGFSPTAVVWHHPRPSLRAFWRQQVGYGEGEAWLRPHHPDKFTQGAIQWHGHIYGGLPYLRSLTRRLINTGIWGTAPFPSVYELHAQGFSWWPHTAVWAVACACTPVVALALLLASMPTIALIVLLLGASGTATTVGRCARYSMATDLQALPPIGRFSGRTSRVIYRAVIAWLHVIQPLARAAGRIRGRSPGFANRPENVEASLNPAPSQLRQTVRFLMTRKRDYWCERWISAEGVLDALCTRLKRLLPESSVQLDDGWRTDRDARVAITSWLALDLRVLVEEHGVNRCLLRLERRFRFDGIFGPAGVCAVALLTVILLARADRAVWLSMTAATLSVFAIAEALRRTLRAAAGVNQALADVVAEFGATVLDVAPSAPAIQQRDLDHDVPSPHPSAVTAGAGSALTIRARAGGVIDPVTNHRIPARSRRAPISRRTKTPFDARLKPEDSDARE
jgi:GT2 family glycosyltransferase